MKGGVLVPAFLAAGIIGVRAVLGHKRAPYPYEYLSWLVVYGGIGLIPGDDAGFSASLAWAYLVAILLAPSFADVLGMLQSAHQTPPPGGGGSAEAAVTPARVSPHTGTTGG